MARCRR